MSACVIDYGAVVAEAFRRPDVLDVLADAIAARVVERLGSTAALDDRLTPFHAIRNCSAPAGRMFLNRNPDLRAQGVLVGRTLHFRPSAVTRWFAEKQPTTGTRRAKPPARGLRAVDGGDGGRR